MLVLDVLVHVYNVQYITGWIEPTTITTTSEFEIF